MALEVNKFTLAGNDIDVVDQYARDKIEEIIHTEVTKAYVDAGDAALQGQIDALPSKTYVDNADSALQTQINGLPSKTYVDNADSDLQTQIDGLPTKTYVDNADSDLQGQINNLPSKTYVDNADSDLQGQINNLPSKTYVDNADSNLQTQINGKQSTITGAASTVTTSNLTASRALGTNGNGKIAVSSVTTTELDYLQGVTSGIQGQLNNKVETSEFNRQYFEFNSDQVRFYANRINTLKLLYFRDNPKSDIQQGWNILYRNGSPLNLPEPFRPITEQYLTAIAPGGQTLTINLRTDGTVRIYASVALSASNTLRFNIIYI